MQPESIFDCVHGCGALVCKPEYRLLFVDRIDTEINQAIMAMVDMYTSGTLEDPIGEFKWQTGNIMVKLAKRGVFMTPAEFKALELDVFASIQSGYWQNRPKSNKVA